jgi:hypothetical protein
MEYLNVHSSTLSSDEYLDSSPDDQAAWLLISSYCANQENSGRIAGAKRWNDDKCLRALKIPRQRLKERALLWRWDGEDLLVEFYPVEQELALQRKRFGAKAGGKARWAGTPHQPEAKPSGEPMAQPEAKPSGEPSLKRKGREGKGKKGKGRVREGGSLLGDSLVPSEAEVREWASSVGVDPDFAAQKRAELCERHGWHQNGRLLDWQSRFQRFWETDGAQWGAFRKKTARGAAGSQLPPEALPTDCAWWWTDSIDSVEGALTGAVLQGGNEKNVARLREVIAVRKKGAA